MPGQNRASGAVAIPLLTNASATGNATGGIDGGTYVWTLNGTIGGATIKLQALGADGSTYNDIVGASLTAAGCLAIDVGAGESIRAVVTGGSPSALYSTLRKVA